MSFRTLVSLLREEMAERRWNARDVTLRRVWQEFHIKELELDLMLAVAEDDTVADEQVLVGDDTLAELETAFGVSSGFFRRIYESAPPVVAVDPHVEDSGPTTPRAEESSSSSSVLATQASPPTPDARETFEQMDARIAAEVRRDEIDEGIIE